MLSVASVTCFFTAYSPFQTTDVVQERRANAARGPSARKSAHNVSTPGLQSIQIPGPGA